MNAPPPLQEPIILENGLLNPLWYSYFDDTFMTLTNSSLVNFKWVTNSGLSGSDITIDSFSVNNGQGAIYIYCARSSGAAKAGILYFPWSSGGSVPGRPGLHDVIVGDPSDLYFEVSVSGGKVYLKSTSSNSYVFSALRIIL